MTAGDRGKGKGFCMVRSLNSAAPVTRNSLSSSPVKSFE
jgi:hypothetical protein